MNIRYFTTFRRRKSARCFLCLQQGHKQTECPSNYKCNICQRRHHISICLKNEKEKEKNNEDASETESQVTSTNTTNYREHILLQTATAHISDVENKENDCARIMFDTGSQRSYITEKTRKYLKLKTIRTEKIIINAFGQMNSTVKNVDIVKLRIRSEKEYREIEAICVPNISKPLKNQNIELAKQEIPELQKLYLADHGGNQDMSIELLIGLDYYYSFFTGIRKQYKSLTAIESIFGWVLCGTIKTNNKTNQETSANLNNTFILRVDCFNEMNRLNLSEKIKTEKYDVNKLWNSNHYSNEDEENEVLSDFKENIKLNEGESRYTVPLPEKQHHELLPDNYNVSMSRLLSLRKKLEADPKLLREYNDIISSFLHEGFIEPVPDESADIGRVHYLAHRAVVREDHDTTKVRIVFDASAKSGDNPSLNDCLYSGPNMLPQIPSILSRFRMGKVGLVADIKQAFYNVEVDEQYRDLLRFFWFKDIHDPNSVVEVKLSGILLVRFGSCHLLD